MYMVLWCVCQAAPGLAHIQDQIRRGSYQRALGTAELSHLISALFDDSATRQAVLKQLHA